MELSIIFLPLIASIISGFFGRYIGDRNSGTIRVEEIDKLKG